MKPDREVLNTLAAFVETIYVVEGEDELVITKGEIREEGLEFVRKYRVNLQGLCSCPATNADCKHMKMAEGEWHGEGIPPRLAVKVWNKVAELLELPQALMTDNELGDSNSVDLINVCVKDWPKEVWFEMEAGEGSVVVHLTEGQPH